MKQSITFVLSLLTIVFASTSCNKYSNTINSGNGHRGALFAELNGSPWYTDNAACTVNDNKEGRINLEAYVSINGALRQQFSIESFDPFADTTYIYSRYSWIIYDSIINRRRGFDTCSGSYNLFASDVGEDIYNLRDEDVNYITVESYDHSTARIKGTFNLTLYRSRPYRPAAQGMPDTLRFRNGSFDAYVRYHP